MIGRGGYGSFVKDQDGPGLSMRDMPKPRCGQNDILVKIIKTAICGTDPHIFNWDKWSRNTVKLPTIIGHGFVVHMVEVGPEVSGLRIGDRVSGEGHITCSLCL